MSTTSEAESYVPYYHHARSGEANRGRKPPAATASVPPSRPLTTRAGILPMGPTFVVGLAIFLSMLFILSVSCAFIADDDERQAFADVLDDVAANTPGIVLIGDDVDVDIDEPQLAIRWSILACGQAYVLPGSEGTHGSQGCGLPVMPLHIFVDGGEEPAATYNPSILPFLNGNGQRHSIQNMFQFDDDHVLDVHEARLYPFDKYHLTASLRVVSTVDNTTLPVQKLATISQTSSFVTMSSDSPSFVRNVDGTEEHARDLDVQVSRPAEARAFALLLFGSSWMLAHTTIALVALSWQLDSSEKVFKHLASTFVIIILIPQLRNAMPDAPGFDGVLIDAIGFFPQMVVCSASAIILFSMMVKRDLGYLEDATPPGEIRKEAPGPLSTGLLRMRRGGASVDISHVRNFSRKLSTLGSIHRA